MDLKECTLHSPWQYFGGGRPGRLAEWLAHRAHNYMIVNLSLTGASNILGQDMNLVNALQCCPSRGQQFVAPEVDLRECICLHNTNKEESNLALKPRGDVTEIQKTRVPVAPK